MNKDAERTDNHEIQHPRSKTHSVWKINLSDRNVRRVSSMGIRNSIISFCVTFRATLCHTHFRLYCLFQSRNGSAGGWLVLIVFVFHFPFGIRANFALSWWREYPFFLDSMAICIRYFWVHIRFCGISRLCMKPFTNSCKVWVIVLIKNFILQNFHMYLMKFCLFYRRIWFYFYFSWIFMHEKRWKKAGHEKGGKVVNIFLVEFKFSKSTFVFIPAFLKELLTWR